MTTDDGPGMNWGLAMIEAAVTHLDQVKEVNWCRCERCAVIETLVGAWPTIDRFFAAVAAGKVAAATGVFPGGTWETS